MDSSSLKHGITTDNTGAASSEDFVESGGSADCGKCIVVFSVTVRYSWPYRAIHGSSNGTRRSAGLFDKSRRTKTWKNFPFSAGNFASSTNRGDSRVICKVSA